jgi:hypothetical protein
VENYLHSNNVQVTFDNAWDLFRLLKDELIQIE